MKYTLNVRVYRHGGEFLCCNQFTYDKINKNAAKALANSIISVANLFGGSPTLAKTNPCNVSLRGPNGRFISWKK